MFNLFEGVGNTAQTLWDKGVDASKGALSSGIYRAKQLGSAVGVGDTPGTGFQFNTNTNPQGAPALPPGGYKSTTDFGGEPLNKPKTEFNFSGTGGMDASNYFTPDYSSVGWKPGANKFQSDDDTFNFIGDTYDKMKAEDKKGFDYELLGRTLASIKPTNEPGPTSSGRVGGSFRFDKSLYENPLLTREYNALYSEPLYKQPW